MWPVVKVVHGDGGWEDGEGGGVALDEYNETNMLSSTTSSGADHHVAFAFSVAAAYLGGLLSVQDEISRHIGTPNGRGLYRAAP